MVPLPAEIVFIDSFRLTGKCLRTYSARYANTFEADLADAVEAEIAEDCYVYNLASDHRELSAICCNQRQQILATVTLTVSRCVHITHSEWLLTCSGSWNGLHLVTSTPRMASSEHLITHSHLNSKDPLYKSLEGRRNGWGR